MAKTVKKSKAKSNVKSKKAPKGRILQRKLAVATKKGKKGGKGKVHIMGTTCATGGGEDEG